MPYLRLLDITPMNSRRLKRGALVVFHINTFPRNIKLILSADKLLRRYKRFLTEYQIAKLMTYSDPFLNLRIRPLTRLPIYRPVFL